jgi:hypothetical protein
MQRLGPPGWGLDATLSTWLCETINVAKSKDVKTGSNPAESCEEGYDSNGAILPMIIMITL